MLHSSSFCCTYCCRLASESTVWQEGAAESAAAADSLIKPDALLLRFWTAAG